MLPPINLAQWIDAHKDDLTPPVCNKQVYEAGDFIIMVIGGPNSRKDYHQDAGAEFFYQLAGDMILRVMENGAPREIPIRQGEIFLLPPMVPHSPQRKADTVGLVIERKRTKDERDGFLWYCDRCHETLYEEHISLAHIESDLPAVFTRFWENDAHRTCSRCHYVMPLPDAA